MRNVSMKTDGNNLVITVDLTKNFGASKSGKTQTIGSTDGFVPFGGGNGEVIYVNLNVNKK